MKKYSISMSIALFLFGAVLLCVSCEDDKDDNKPSASFDRTELLAHYDQQILYPALTELKTSAETLKSSVYALSVNRTPENLETAQNAWMAAANGYAGCFSINFGPGETLFGSFAENVGTFPVSEQKISSYITNADTTHANFDRDTRGIYGLEYLLFQSGAFSDFSDADYAAYARSTSAHLLEEVTKMVSGWEGYRTGFSQDNGTGSSSSITEMYNEWLKGFELVKNFMVGVPAGLRIGQNAAAPEQVAGFYSKQSKALLRQHLLHIEAMYFGAELPQGENAVGFDDYLLTTVGGSAVLEETKTQWSAIWSAFNALPDAPLDELVVSHPNEIDALYTELSKHTRFFKSELASRLGLTITYDSGDGD